MKKLNCWEYKRCGREPGGKSVSRLGVCRSASDDSYTGINAGKCGGRFCWAVAGTFCHEKVDGVFAKNMACCTHCDFYQLVRAEEGTANLRTKFLRFVPFNGKGSLIGKMTRRHINRGERFITQGEPGDSAYIIQRGSCHVVVEKKGVLHPVDHRSEGDIVDMMALFTGEARTAHVEAETDMDVWVVNKALLDDISQNDPDLLDFLSEMVADRFDSRRPVAERTIAKYIATDIIGRGGYSIIYKGVHSELGMPVVIKMMRHNLAMDPDFLKSFRNEARLVAGFNHENIVRVHDFEERFKTVFIIMEYLEGEPLKEMLKRCKKIPPVQAANYLAQVCSGLGYTHKRGIIHRDINPSNIFVQPGNRIKIIDFGLACPIGIEDIDTLGTLAYVAPEQIEAETVDQRTDIYALGITAYEMVTGTRPFPEEKPGILIRMHLENEIPDPKEKVPDLPEELHRFILKACRRTPGERYQNMEQALNGLKQL